MNLMEFGNRFPRHLLHCCGVVNPKLVEIPPDSRVDEKSTINHSVACHILEISLSLSTRSSCLPPKFL